jgi:hypothetical protein
MNAASSSFERGQRTAGIIGAVALAVAVVWAWITPDSLAPAWRCAVFLCAGPALGSLVFALIYALTGGEWGRALRPFLLSGARLLPWAWWLVLPLAVILPRGAEHGAWSQYTSPGFFTARAVLYGAMFLFLAWACGRAWPRQRETPPGWRWVGAFGSIVVLFMTHLLAADWLESLDPHWRSTAFPAVWLCGQAVAGLSVAVLAAIAGGADLTRRLGYHRHLGIDWGTLLFAAAMFWCYVAFCQFLIIWSGNLPHEASWYTQRSSGVWRYLPLALVLLNFVAPLGVLLSREAKQKRRALAVVAGLLFAGQSLQTAWIILPAFPHTSRTMPGLALVLTVALGGVFTNRYLAAARKELAS